MGLVVVTNSPVRVRHVRVAPQSRKLYLSSICHSSGC